MKTLSIGTLLYILLTTIAPAQEYWAVKRDFWECLKGSINKYLEQGSSIVLVVQELCPDPDQKLAYAYSSQNSGLINPSEFEKSSLEKKKQVLTDRMFFSKTDLKCLSDLEVQINADIAEIPKNPCE